MIGDGMLMSPFSEVIRDVAGSINRWLCQNGVEVIRAIRKGVHREEEEEEMKGKRCCPTKESDGIHGCERKQGCVECEIMSIKPGSDDKGFVAMHRSGNEDMRQTWRYRASGTGTRARL